MCCMYVTLEYEEESMAHVVEEESRITGTDIGLLQKEKPTNLSEKMLELQKKRLHMDKLHVMPRESVQARS